MAPNFGNQFLKSGDDPSNERVLQANVSIFPRSIGSRIAALALFTKWIVKKTASRKSFVFSLLRWELESSFDLMM
jgi:hypothetical protein